MRRSRLLLALVLFACAKRPPEQTLPPGARIPTAPEDVDTRARFESDLSLSDEGLELGYRPVDPHDPAASCCGYDTAQVILIGTAPARSQAIMPFTYGEWSLIYRAGERLWAFNQTELPEGGCGTLEIVYSPDRGSSWYSLSSLPSPSTDTVAQQAPIAAVAFDASGRGSVTLQLERDDEDTHVAPMLWERLLIWASWIPGLGRWISAPLVDSRVAARAGYYTYETGDFGQTWSQPRYSRTPPAAADASSNTRPSPGPASTEPAP